MSNDEKSFNFSNQFEHFIYNYFNNSIKLFLDLYVTYKFLGILAKLFFS